MSSLNCIVALLATPQRTYEEVRKIAAALLAGQMAELRYATALADAKESGLEAYERMYDPTCRRK